MKCPDSSCGYETTRDNLKFCPECGKKLMADSGPESLVILCNGTLDGGSTCNAELNRSQKFCSNCGQKVDPNLFSILEEKCHNCGTVLVENNPFCGECGAKLGQQPIQPPVVEKGVVGKEVGITTTMSDKMEEHVEAISSESLPGKNITSDANSQPTDGSMEYITSEGSSDGNPPLRTISNKESNDPEQSNSHTNVAIDFKEDTVPGDASETQQTCFVPVIEDNDELMPDGQVEKMPIQETGSQIMPESDNSHLVSADQTGENGQKGNLLIINEGKSDEEAEKLPNLGSLEIVEESNSEDEMKDVSADINSATNAENTSATNAEINGSKRKGKKDKTDQKKRQKTELASSSGDGASSQPEQGDNSTDPDNDLEKEHYQNKSELSHLDTNQSLDSAITDTNMNEKERHHSNEVQSQNDSTQQPVFGEAQKWINKEVTPIQCEESTKHENTGLFSTQINEYNIQDTNEANQDGLGIETLTALSSADHGQESTGGTGGEAHRNPDGDPDEDRDDSSDDSSKGGGSDSEDMETESPSGSTSMEQEDLNTKNLIKKQKRNQTGREKRKRKIEKQKARNPKSVGQSSAKNDKPVVETGSPDCVTVIFHVLVSPSFKFDSSSQNVVLRMGDEALGNKWNKDILLSLKRNLPGGVAEMTYEMKFPKYKVHSSNPINYKYVVRKLKKDNQKYIWEDYIKNKKSGKEANRTLFIPNQWKDQEIWHQYDGFIEKEDTSILHTVTEFISGNWKKHLLSQVNLALEIFVQHIYLPAEQDSCHLAEPFLELEMLVRGLYKVYGIDAKCWSDDNYFKKEMGSKIISAVIACLNMDNMTTCGETLAQKEQRISLALGLMISIRNMRLNCTDVDLRQQLCKLLLIQDQKEKNTCKEIQIMEKYFPKKKETVLGAIISFAKEIAQNSNDPCWMYLMPWIHILSDSVTPYEKPRNDLTHDHYSAKWWGIDRIGKDSVDYFKGKSDKWRMSLEQVLEDLCPLFELDYLLPRSMVAGVGLGKLQSVIQSGMIPLEICLAATFFFIRKSNPKVYSAYFTTIEPLHPSKDEQVVCEITAVLKELLITFENVANSEQSRLLWSMRYKIAIQMLNESSVANRNVLYSNCAQIVVYSISIMDTLMEEKKDADHCQALQMSGMNVGQWVNRWFWNWNVYMEDNLMVWNSVLASGNYLSKRVQKAWNKSIVNHLKNTLLNKVLTFTTTTREFVQLYCKKLDTFNPVLQDVLSQSAFRAISAGYNISYASFAEHERGRFGTLLSLLFMDEWKKTVKQNDEKEGEMILNHVIRWPPFIQFLNIYSLKRCVQACYDNILSSIKCVFNLKAADQEKLKLLSEECTTAIVQAVSAVNNRTDALLSGSITIGDLEILGGIDSKFAEIVEMLDKGKRLTKDILSNGISIRKREIHAFQTQCGLVSTLTSLCTRLQVDADAVYDTLNKQEDIKNHQVKEFCTPADIFEVAAVRDFQPKLCAFDFSESVFAILPELFTCYKSSTFVQMWDGMCSAKNSVCQSLDDVVVEVWGPVKKSWDGLAKKISSGKITFQELEKHVGRMYRQDYKKMTTELLPMKIKDDVICKRLGQLEKYRQLGACVKGAKVILNFQKEYGLTGDFCQIKSILQHDQTSIEMRAFDEKVMKTCELLKEVTDEKAKCLDVFIKCEQLVSWLKTSMKKSGLKELKVFIDLAFMSAGDEPINIQRVQCLHSAVTGYGPLIFDLKQKAGYQELLDICRIVWKDLEADENLPQKMIDTNRNLEWLKGIKKAHGSVEVTSLVQSDVINTSGIYTVGRRAYKDRTDDNALDLARALKLTVSEVEGKTQLRNYTYENLQDLQSRLMLVAGKAEKGTNSVDRFTSIFDSVTRLANVNMKLCSAGCVLFKDWTARFLCDKRKPVCAVLEFGQDENSPTLKGRRSDLEDLDSVIPKIAKLMEQCLEKWLTYIKEKRKEYTHLNFFTIDQLVILQRELVKVGTDRQPCSWIFPLLSAVKKDCTPDDLLTAMSDTKKDIEGPVEMGEVEEEANMGEDGHGDEDELRQQFIDELVDSGYDEKLALKALEYIDPSNVADGIMWCLNHEEEMEPDSPDEDTDETELQQATPAGPAHTFEGWSQSTTSIQSLIIENIQGLKGAKNQGSSVNSLLQELDTLWAKFLGSISSNIQDYLSLEHLGMILRKLAAKETNHVRRQFPAVFQEGTPNLIICPSGEVLNTVLSLYMLEKDQPLPQSDEILMCTPQTTIDEVDIFWRRAIFGGGKKIHCLVNSDYLDFDVSDAAERQLEQYIQETNHTGTENLYRLVVVCGSDNEYRSRIVASLDKHRRPALPVKPAALKEYLAVKLQQGQALSGIQPASFVDFNRSTVRVVKSWRAGVGKTLYKSRRENDLRRLNGNRVKQKTVSIPLQEKVINLHWVITRLLEHTRQPGTIETRLFHIDVAHEVQEGVDYLLFNLLVLGCLTDKTGFVWRKSPTDFYLIETLPLMILNNNKRGEDQFVHQMFNILPDMTCRSPQESLMVYNRDQVPNGYEANDQLFDNGQFSSSTFQRPYQYLCRLDQARDLKDVRPDVTEGSPTECLQTLLRHCGVQDPSWAELHHFVWFLNTQLRDFETCEFVKAAVAEDLPGFAQFVLRFLIQMSRDFSTRSLKMSEESPGLRAEKMEVTDEEDGEGQDENLALEQYQLRRTWESSPHPYLFFNSDHLTFTFLGFYIDRAAYNLIDQQTGQVLEQAIMQKNLYESLVCNFVPIQESFDKLPRDQKIMKMCNVMGIGMPYDPDDTYELTTDNVKKIMAIYMRFRCDIPVIIMGETGCGKTRLVKFMCGLQVPPGMDDVKNMILMKVHGGTTNTDIIKKVREAEEIAVKNVRDIGPHMYTVLFFDEANTTESIGLIKEIMCDKSMEGKKLKLCENLKMVAACNPYRKHSPDLIKKLEQAGLGYHVDADNTQDKLGHVPMRQLVYRVQPLPQSLLPLVWDFGQLNTQVEDLYIRQMVKRYIRMGKLPDIPNLIEVVSAILTASQDYMRDQKDECSFVSLRDVERVLSVMSWFYEKSQEDRTLFDRMDGLLDVDDVSDIEDEEDEDDEESYMDVEGTLDDVTRSLVLSLGVCYHACLKTRDRYREHVAPFFRPPCVLKRGPDQMEEEINVCQDVFLSNVQLENNIARNMALKENVFMMVVCIELRIPLFLVGKPGSSKSLAKTIVSDAMQGNASRKPLFKELKQAQMVSFQCSPLATPDGIVGTFRQCAQFQKDKDLDTFVSIVVLDEVGLAEDSPRMPLKTLHPLLEDGCQGDEKPEPFKKVAFIGISNWALDPAKMNRGILVQREVPDQEELENSARGICGKKVLNRIEPLIVPMCEAYLEVFMTATTKMREFFGLRDFYSLMKMVCAFAEKSKQKPTWHEILHAIKRNFGGLEQEKVDPEKFFRKKLAKKLAINEKRKDTDPDSSAAGLIDACLFERNRSHGESRYLLLLTENYGSLTILQQQILSRQRDIKPITIFGSSFRSDQEYTQVCRNINKIKVCMETGNTVVLLNLENLYESLYDALNQYYVYFGGERYVDLGLGTHRVKCPVHKKFRLIVVAEKQTVYEKFPIPLINRLEKHFLTINTMLSREQQKLAQKLEDWAKQFATQNDNNFLYKRVQKQKPTQKVGDVFMGYHDDTCSAIILHVCTNTKQGETSTEKILREAKSLLLWVATPQSVVRLNKSRLSAEEQKQLRSVYFEKQRHEGIVEYLHQKLVVEELDQLFVQVTTHSKLLATYQKTEISEWTKIPSHRIMLLDTLSSFDTEQQFSNKIQQYLQKQENQEPCLLIIQCDSGDVNANLVACARYCVMDEYQKVRDEGGSHPRVHVVFIVQLPNIAGGCYTGFQCGVWHSVHIDDLWTGDTNMPPIEEMQTKSVSNLIQDAVMGQNAMETNDEEQQRNTSETMDWEDEQIPPPREPGERMEMGEPVPSTSHHEEDIATSHTIGLEDVIVGFELSGKRHTGPGKSLNVKNLILSCTQSALSMLKDKSENHHRTTERVSLVLTLFHGQHLDGFDMFLQGMCSLIASLLKEKDRTTNYGNRAESWLVNEAASQENIQKAGTFRRSCQLTLESKISPILAGILAHLDTNQNLDILTDSEVPWKRDMWLAVLNEPDALQLKYSDLWSQNRQSEYQEVVVLTTGCEGHIFKARMPFSWLIQQKLVEIMRTPMPDSEEEEMPQDKIDFYVRVFEKTPIGKVLSQFPNSNLVREMAEEYLHDFVSMCYKALSQEEMQLVCQSVRYLYNNTVAECGYNSLPQLLLCIQDSYRQLAPRLTYFHTMNIIWPECSASIVKTKEENPEHVMFQEEEFTFSTLCLLIEHLTPNKTELDQAAGRSRWLKKVHSFRPVIEKVLRLHAEDPAIYGAHSFQSVHRARCSWNRVVVIKLFLEHVCVVEKEEKITVKQCIPLWKVLTEEADLKEIKSLEAIEKILKICNVKAIKHFLGGQEKCCYCDDAIEGPPIVLPCKDIYCDACYQNMVAMGDNKCLKCNKEIPKDWSLERQTEKRTEKKQLVSYQKRCNSFFMDVVSQLCFYDNTPPSEAVIDRLLQYITYTTKNNQKKVTKDMTIFNTGLDPNPVFRSFLLQLLMRTSEEKVMTNVDKYIKQANALLDQPQSGPVTHQGFIELNQLVIQCLEDIMTQKLSKCGEPLAESTRCLERAMQTIFSDELNVEKLYGIAEARLGLATVANVLADVMRGKMDIGTKVRRLILAAEILCENERTKYPKIYLVKYMCRRFGIDIYQQVCQSEKRFLMWIAQGGRQENQRVEISDRYVLCGQTYTTIREALTKVVLGEDIRHLDETLQGLKTSQPHVHTLLSLALYREITCSLLYPTQQRKIKDKERQLLHDYLQASSNKEILQNYLDNTWQTCPHLKVQEGMDFRHQGLQTLLVHFLSVTSHLQEDRTLLRPFMGIIRTPQQYVNCFIPTMPQDDLDDVKQALLAARDAGGGENPVFYRCPRGHPYVIGNCGRPYVVERCKCGEEIGGRSHVLLQTNKLDQGADETETGHILGPVGNRERGPRPERQMTPLYCACVRLFTHLSMYLGTMTDPQAIQTMIKPGVPKEQVADYLWGHLQADMDDLERGLERSIDDTFVLLHTIIDVIMKTHKKGGMVNDQVRNWTTKKGRNDWENQFVKQYLQPVIQECDHVLHLANHRLVQDQRLGADPLLCLLYEIDTQQVEENPNNIENIPSVWRYRLAITLGHLTQAFEAKKAAAKGHDKQLAVLNLFLKEEHYLRAMRCIPSILKLQRELLHKYQRKLEKVSIVNSKLTIGYIKREKIVGEETEQLVEDFETAWNICRKSLKQYLCPTELGGMVVREEFCRPVNDDTPIAILLPAIKDEGLCSYAMLDFLLRKQNDFLDKYATETSKTQKRSTDNIGKVQPMEVTSAHLISYDPQQDLLPLILANCQYSFEIGKGTNLEYDFMSLERQIMDRFLFSKSKIDVGPFLQIDLMMYAAEFTDGEVFDKLAEKIPQEELSSAIKTQICLELKSLPELCQSLNNLDITISFLKSIGGNPDESLERFMSETLQMKHTVHSQKVRQSCLFKHIKPLWLLLALEKSKKMAEHRQPIENICESVSAQFQEVLPEEIEAELREFMRDISVDKLGDLVSTLHEYILLVVAIRENRDNEEYVDTTDRVLKVWLAEYSDEKTSVLQILNNFPDSILYKHSVYTWVTAYSVLYEKKTGDRRF